MFPENALSSTPVPSPFLVPIKVEKLKDRALGGSGLNDTSEGLLSQMWQMDYASPFFTITSPTTESEVVLAIEGVTEFTFAFDQNMQPCIAYMLGNALFFWHFDSLLGDYRTINYGSLCRNPRVRLDDGRALQTGNSDVTLSYIEGNQLLYRLQRERYGVKHIVTSDIGLDDVLVDAGMSTGFRFQFQIEAVTY